eukprot:CAMPEP_0197532116 /NCGR_PEP_ID=MMETSP1318-20131121/38586_1 /TAXON_ID=552666 /ORGANISM="Partenskyella glossopodia, Strain RCC365" /LENGTH=183 /DNA_ID=CAMNT_0043088581 /DNA_START=450 /DNA_END=999 /DNA_ORIENTATION=+
MDNPVAVAEAQRLEDLECVTANRGLRQLSELFDHLIDGPSRYKLHDDAEFFGFESGSEAAHDVWMHKGLEQLDLVLPLVHHLLAAYLIRLDLLDSHDSAVGGYASIHLPVCAFAEKLASPPLVTSASSASAADDWLLVVISDDDSSFISIFLTWASSFLCLSLSSSTCFLSFLISRMAHPGDP